jgi:hypothetical protein
MWRLDLGSVHIGFVVDEVALGQVFLQVLRLSPVIFIPPVLHYTEKQNNLIIFIIFLIGLHNKPSGCGASVASAAGPFNKKKCEYNRTYLHSCLLRPCIGPSSRYRIMVEKITKVYVEPYSHPQTF